MIHKPTIAGHLAYVLDENKNICIGPKTGVWFDGEYYPADETKGGKIFIPYGKQQKSSSAILINNGFAQLCEFERQTETYNFTTWFYINPESILIGSKASVMVRPTLTVNGRQASLELLKNAKITLTTKNYTEKLPVTKTFDNLKFKNNKELIIDFQVPPYL